MIHRHNLLPFLPKETELDTKELEDLKKIIGRTIKIPEAMIAFILKATIALLILYAFLFRPSW